MARTAVHGRGRTAATVAGLGLAVVAIVAAVTFQASLQRLVDTPQRYGLTGDLTIVDAREPDVAELVADRRVAALDVVTSVRRDLRRRREAPATAVGGTPEGCAAGRDRRGPTRGALR